MATIAPYCGLKLLQALIDLASHNTGSLPLQTWWALKSRGWMDWDSKITPKGVAYVNMRSQLTQRSQK